MGSLGDADLLARALEFNYAPTLHRGHIDALTTSMFALDRPGLSSEWCRFSSTLSENRRDIFCGMFFCIQDFVAGVVLETVKLAEDSTKHIVVRLFEGGAIFVCIYLLVSKNIKPKGFFVFFCVFFVLFRLSHTSLLQRTAVAVNGV